MLIKQFILLILVLLPSFAADNKPDCEYEKIIRGYLISKGELKPDEKTSVYAIELLNHKSNNYGVYKIGNFSDHGLDYLLLVDKTLDEYIFLDFDNLTSLLEQLLTFLEKHKVTDSNKLKYIQEILKISNRNKNAIPW